MTGAFTAKPDTITFQGYQFSNLNSLKRHYVLYVARNIIVALLLTFFITPVPGQTIKPYRYWTFEEANNFRDKVANFQLGVNAKACPVQVRPGQCGQAIDLQKQNCLISTNALHDNISTECTVEFLFKGSNILFLTYGAQQFMIKFDYFFLLFRTSVLKNGKVESDDMVISLNGTSKRSYNYYTDDKWHHLVFTVSTKTGKKEIWIDGELPDGFSKTITKGPRLSFGGSDGFRNTDQIDELAFYNTVLPAALIQQHAREADQKQHYTFFASNQATARSATSKKAEKPELDPLEFAPGYPNYTIQALDQLRSFPLPRYSTENVTKRNFSWMDINYLHRELPQAGGMGFGKSDPVKAVQLTDEMVRNWNYYIEIPCVRGDSLALNKIYRNSGTLQGALIKYANNHPQFSWATITIQAQNRAKHAGFDLNGPYVSSQNLPEIYYLQDVAGKPILNKKKKVLSPIMPLDVIQRDGQTSQFYVRGLLKHVKTPPALISENGELFGHMRPESLLKKDPQVRKQMEAMKMSNAQYNGWFQNRLDSCYKSEVMKLPELKHSKFSFYNVSAINPSHWPDYAMRRKVNEWSPGLIYPTPDFYPCTPENWRNAQGSHNGYGTVSYGRRTEIALGDKMFSPFVSAGWGKEENNIRPAQWLALLKAMMMLGADFYYVGYFNVTGAGGKWPNGAGPNDPRGYAYQIAMPAYAQAIGSFVTDFLTKGQLLNPADPKDKIRQFRFKGKAENELILVRKLGKKYLIYGSIQPNSNLKGNVPQQATAQINLEGKKIRFTIRRQGSIYILDMSKSQPVFYELDGWHEYKHPSFWSKDIVIEAELPKAGPLLKDVFTDFNSKENDYSNATTFYSLIGNNDRPKYIFEQRQQGNYTCFVRARTNSGKEEKLSMAVTDPAGNTGSVIIKGADWKWYQVKASNLKKDFYITCSAGKPVTVMLQAQKIDVDKFVITNTNNYPH